MIIHNHTCRCLSLSLFIYSFRVLFISVNAVKPPTNKRTSSMHSNAELPIQKTVPPQPPSPSRPLEFGATLVDGTVAVPWRNSIMGNNLTVSGHVTLPKGCPKFRIQ